MARYKQMRTTVVAVSLLVAANAAAAEKQFRARDAGKYPAHQTQADVTVGVRPYRAEKETREKLSQWVNGIFYSPFDLPFVLDRVFRTIRPRLVIVAETEIWPNLFRLAKRSTL